MPLFNLVAPLVLAGSLAAPERVAIGLIGDSQFNAKNAHKATCRRGLIDRISTFNVAIRPPALDHTSHYLTTSTSHPPELQAPRAAGDRAEPDLVVGRDPAARADPRDLLLPFVLLDTFSRYIVGWTLTHAQTGQVATRLIRQACRKQAIGAGQLTLHADRGSVPTGDDVADVLHELGAGRFTPSDVHHHRIDAALAKGRSSSKGPRRIELGLKISDHGTR